ncbi:hypothetical protein [Rhodococcus qingshengii]|uniref:hypothetical protein n=1 Tax=Rhodococcus qingshengii TaxID=334542 RepID=UPI0035DD6CDC
MARDPHLFEWMLVEIVHVAFEEEAKKPRRVSLGMHPVSSKYYIPSHPYTLEFQEDPPGSSEESSTEVFVRDALDIPDGEPLCVSNMMGKSLMAQLEMVSYHGTSKSGYIGFTMHPHVVHPRDMEPAKE